MSVGPFLEVTGAHPLRLYAVPDADVGHIPDHGPAGIIASLRHHSPGAQAPVPGGVGREASELLQRVVANRHVQAEEQASTMKKLGPLCISESSLDYP